MKAGYARTELSPPGTPVLIGVYTRKPRLGKTQRDPLFARAIALETEGARVVIVACDLLLISEELHRALGAAVPELGQSGIVLLATHTHSSFGGFFKSSATAAMLGAFDPDIFTKLTQVLADLVRAALADLAPAEAAWGEAEVAGLTASRRQAGGPFDDSFSLLRLSRKGRRPIDLVACSGHPVVVAEREPEAVSADYPGRLCLALQARGSDPLFVSAALGGVSILFPEFAMAADRHLDLLEKLLLQGFEAAVSALVDLPPAPLRVDFFHLDHAAHQSRIFSSLGATGRLADRALAPLLARLVRAGRQALPNPAGVPMHLVRLGDFCLLGSAAELGVSVVAALRHVLHQAGHAYGLVASLADGYAGYTHLAPIYARWPEKGYRFMALYENALGLFGHDLGQRLLAGVRTRLGQNPPGLG